MLAETFADQRMTAVIAHTLAERNASNRFPEKAGFHRDGVLYSRKQYTACPAVRAPSSAGIKLDRRPL